MKTYIIKGDPTPLMRAGRNGKRTFDPQKNLKLIAGIDITSQHNDAPLLEGDLHLDVTFFMEAPKSISAKRRKDLFGKYYVFKPDLDNLIKFLGDVCNGILYYDDCIIAKITAKKIYDETPRTEFTLTCMK